MKNIKYNKKDEYYTPKYVINYFLKRKKLL